MVRADQLCRILRIEPEVRASISMRQYGHRHAELSRCPGWPLALALLLQVPFDLLPHNADELDGIANLLAYWNGVGADIALLAQTEGGDATGVLQPPILRWLPVAWRGHRLAHAARLVEVMGLHGRGGDVQLLDVPGPEVDDLVDVLESAFDKQELGIR